jgi:hypothetical protein
MEQHSPEIGGLPSHVTLADIARIVDERVRALLDESRRAAVAPSAPEESKRQAQEEIEFKHVDRARQRHLVHTSRASVSNLIHEAVNVTFNQQAPYATPTSTPRRTNPPAQSQSAFARRMSIGYADGSGPGDPVTESPAAIPVTAEAEPASVPLEKMNAEQRRRFETTAKQLAVSVSKFHGDRVKDGERTVEEFVELINAEMDTWLTETQQHGRLHLVIGRTDGAAQTWLAKKRQEMKKLHAAGHVTDLLLMEWCEVQDDFITEMSKGITSAVYEQQLRALKVRDKDGKMDVAAFIRRFDQICARLYPSARFTSEADRRWRLGEKFEERLRYCGEGTKLRDDCHKMLIARSVPEKERTVDEWQDVLLAVASTDEYLHAKAVPVKEQGQQKKQPYRPRVSAMAATQSNATGEGEESTASDEDRAEGAQAAAVVADKSKGQTPTADKGKRNPHISQPQLELLLGKRVCVSCYRKGHFSRDCRNPANRPPTEAELN